MTVLRAEFEKGKADIDIRDAFFDELYDITIKDKGVIFLTADMGALSLEKFRKDLPDQYINVGVAEQSLVSIAAGLSLSGKRVFIYTIASFLTARCYEQIKIDLVEMRLPVTLVGSGGGICYSSDGPTHHAKEDVAIMRALPDITIINPADPQTARAAAKIGYRNDGPVYVRLDKGKPPVLYDDGEDFTAGIGVLREGRDLLIVTSGMMVHKALAVADVLKANSLNASILDVYRLKPINEMLLFEKMKGCNSVAVLEELSEVGGLGSVVARIIACNQWDKGPIKFFALPDQHDVGYGDREWMLAQSNLDAESVANELTIWLVEK